MQSKSGDLDYRPTRARTYDSCVTVSQKVCGYQVEFVGLLFEAQFEAGATVKSSLLLVVTPLLTLFPPVHLLA